MSDHSTYTVPQLPKKFHKPIFDIRFFCLKKFERKAAKCLIIFDEFWGIVDTASRHAEDEDELHAESVVHSYQHVCMDPWDPWIGQKFDAEIEEHNKHDGDWLVPWQL